MIVAETFAKSHKSIILMVNRFTTQYFLQDAQNSTQALSDTSGAVTSQSN